MELFWRTTYYTVQAEKLGYDSIWITDHFNNRNVYVSIWYCLWGVGTFIYNLDKKERLERLIIGRLLLSIVFSSSCP